MADRKLNGPDDEILAIKLLLKSRYMAEDGDEKLNALHGIAVNKLLASPMIT